MHYTLLSGKDTTTCTFKCDGCMRRVAKGSEIHSETREYWNVITCSVACTTLANTRYNTLLIASKGNATVKDIFEHNGIDFRGLVEYVELHYI